jgi:hypothetical protein
MHTDDISAYTHGHIFDLGTRRLNAGGIWAMLGAGGFGYFLTEARYSSTTFSVVPKPSRIILRRRGVVLVHFTPTA